MDGKTKSAVVGAAVAVDAAAVDAKVDADVAAVESDGLGSELAIPSLYLKMLARGFLT